jgi:putative acetyltransferase
MDDVVVEPVQTATPEVRGLIEALDRGLAELYVPEQQHGLSLDAIFQPHVRFFVARANGMAAGCGGVALFATFGEVKRMYVRDELRGRGIAQAVLARLERETKESGLELLRLETGVRQFAAIRLYERAGYRQCDAFGDYASMPDSAIATSIFYEKRLAAATDHT